MIIKRWMLLSAMALALAVVCATAPPVGEETESLAATHTLQEIAPGVFFAQGDGIGNGRQQFARRRER